MKFHLATLGCPKNTVDSEMMAKVLAQAGHLPVAQVRQADVLIVNTCGFIAPAREESYALLRRLGARKRRRQWLVAAGCLAERCGQELIRQVPQIDAVIGTRSWSQIGAVVEWLASGRGVNACPVPWGGGGEHNDLVTSLPRRATMGRTAYLKIADGCSATCSFCAIPLIKGPQCSKPPDVVLREARELATEGVREVVLVAQNTTAYGRDLGLRDALPDLLGQIASVAPQVRWLRLLYSYPQQISQRLLEVMAGTPAVCHYLDLPLQHGHPDTLRRMGRPYDPQAAYDLISSIRRAVPDIALRTSFIVGFPGETEAEFEMLLDFMWAIAFDKVGVFAYSAEEGTAAAGMAGHLPAELIQERHQRAMLTQQRISLQRNREQVGRTLDVLVEGTNQGLTVGRSYREAPEIDGAVLMAATASVGEFVCARVVAAQEYDLIAEPLQGLA